MICDNDQQIWVQEIAVGILVIYVQVTSLKETWLFFLVEMETMTQEMEISCEQQVSVFEQVMETYAYKVMETFCVESMNIYGA